MHLSHFYRYTLNMFLLVYGTENALHKGTQHTRRRQSIVITHLLFFLQSMTIHLRCLNVTVKCFIDTDTDTDTDSYR